MVKVPYCTNTPKPNRRQSKMLLTIDERRLKITRTSVFDRHCRQMAIENSVSSDYRSTFVEGIIVFDCPISGVTLFLIGLNSLPKD